MREKLLSCPFCGGEPAFNYVRSTQYKQDAPYLYCTACYAQTSWKGTKKAAIALWNRRTETPKGADDE